MLRGFATILFALTFCFIAAVAYATDWYVRPAGGSYGNEDGTSYENAWNGFSNIVWGTGGVQAGDTLWLDGTFTSSTLIVQADNVTIRSYNPATPAKISGMYRAIVIRSDNYLYGAGTTIRDIEISDTTNVGILVLGFDNISLINLYIHNTGSHGASFGDDGASNYPENILISGCIFSNCGSPGSAGRAVWGNVGGHSVVRNCLFYGSDDNGSSLIPAKSGTVLEFIDCVSQSNGDNGFGIASNVEAGCEVKLIRCKMLDNSGAGVLIHSNYSSSVTFQYCLIARNTYGISRNSTAASSVHFYNCTFKDNIVYAIKAAGSEDVTCKNSIFINNGASSGSERYEIEWLDTGQTLVSDYNCILDDAYIGTILVLDTSVVEDFATWKAGHGQAYDQHSINTDPVLTSDYHLTRNSPCIDAGTIVTGVHDQGDWRDLDGNWQKYGSAPDIGCYEYNSDLDKRWGGHAWGAGRWGVGRWDVNRWEE